jgi:1,4-alpha-glucan branching enzyme
MKRRHAMPFGAELDDGVGRFRLWAPGAAHVALEITHERGRHLQPLAAEEGGWFSAEVSNLAAGARYRYRRRPHQRAGPGVALESAGHHAASALVDPLAFEWSDASWRGRPWEEAVIYELHVGTFTPEGTFNAVVERLDYPCARRDRDELMPVADFPGKRNWGYDGVLPFAPDAATAPGPENLVVAAHALGS